MDLLGKEANAMDFYREIAGLVGKGAIYYLPSPELALPLVKERLIISHAAFEPPEQLRQRSYQGFPKEGVVLVLQTSLISNGKADLIKKSFLDIPGWKEIRLASAPEWRAFVSSR